MSCALIARRIVQSQIKSCSSKLTSCWFLPQRWQTNTEIEETLQQVREGKFDKFPNPQHLDHFRTDKNIEEKDRPLGSPKPIGAVAMPHPLWTDEELYDVKITHKTPDGFVDKLAFNIIQTLRKTVDVLSGFNDVYKRDERQWINRIIFLETVAAVPGMVAAMTRHLYSLRRMRRDYGWIHTLLEEAENERMHLMAALQLRNPSYLFRFGVVATQGLFVTWFTLSYILSPRFCHRFVGYLEEEAVKTYTKCLGDIENGLVKHWQTAPGPEVALTYWKMPDDATMKDVILAIRADEAHHRLVNHTLASMKKTDYNPYEPGK